jgi:hypothetical protein
MITLTMQLSMMDSVIPDLTMVLACCTKSPILLVAVLFPYAYFLPQQRWDKPPESYLLLCLVTHDILGLEFLTELLICRDSIFAEVATHSPLPLMRLYQHKMIRFPGASFWFAFACVRLSDRFSRECTCLKERYRTYCSNYSAKSNSACFRITYIEFTSWNLALLLSQLVLHFPLPQYVVPVGWKKLLMCV